MSNKTKCIKLYDKIVNAFNNQSGGEWNDTMYYQALGAKDEIHEAEYNGESEDWDYALKNLTKCWIYQEHCAKLDKMSENMPDAVYC
tara:strand:- start:414 stop:674 length:261 start_codon:yes stop_codon:yes gene_type:complete